MSGIDALPPLREVIAQHGLRAEKRFGQNFLLDLNLTGRIARTAGPLSGMTVVEIGPGPGGLTRALLAAGAARVIALELDSRCLPALAELAAAAPGRLEVIQADALHIDLRDLIGTAPTRIVANLPYNVATALLLRWLPYAPRFSSLTLMFQREVAERLVATPRTAAYGRLSVATQWRCQADIQFDINPRAFTPAPKVISSVVHLRPLAEPLAPADPVVLERVTAAAFGQRRKMLRAALRQLFSDPEKILLAAGIAPTARAEELSVAEFCALARAAA